MQLVLSVSLQTCCRKKKKRLVQLELCVCGYKLTAV